MRPLSAQQSNFHMCITLIVLVQVLALKKNFAWSWLIDNVHSFLCN